MSETPPLDTGTREPRGAADGDTPAGSTAVATVDPRMNPALLRRIIAASSAGLELEETLRGLAEVITEATATDVCFVHLLDEDGHHLTLSGATPPFDRLASTVRLEVGEGVAGWVAMNGVPAIVDDKWTDPRYKYFPELRGEDFASLVSVPMRDRSGRVVGVLNVHSRRRRSFDADDVALLSQVANLMAGAVENSRLYTRLAEREEALERFAQKTLNLQEAERRRLAGEIHDGISQRIVSLGYHLSAAAGSTPPPSERVVAELEAAQALAADALDEARAAIVGLRPPMLDDLGLGACLRALVGHLPATMISEAVVDDCDCDPHIETAIYRLAQEALQNVVKHSQAAHAAVELRCERGRMWLVVSDDGVGFDPEDVPRTGGVAYGLTGMRARAELVGADLSVSSRPGEGTVVRVSVPCRAGADNAPDREP